MTNIVEEIQLDYCDVMIKPKRSVLNSRKEPDIYRTYTLKWSSRTLFGNGLTVANMATTGTFAMARVMAKNLMFTCLQKHYTFEEVKQFLEENTKLDEAHPINEYVFVSTGIKEGDYEKICKILDMGLCKNVCVDIANGYISNLLEFVRNLRKRYEDIIIMVGNVVTGDMVQDLILNGADIVKVGIGPGSNCTTRKMTGVGRPQLSAVIECAEAAHAVDGMICADGGINCVGDVNKAFGAGADFVMVGSMVAGSDEAEGEVIEKLIRTNEYDYEVENDLSEDSDKVFTPLKPKFEVKRFKLAYGMSSKYAQDKHWNGMANYRASEGIVTLKPYTGAVQNTIDEYIGGLRSCMTYISAKRLKNIPKCCTFYRANRVLNNDGKGIM